MLDLADRLLSRTSLRSSETTARIATLARDAGLAPGVPGRAAVLLAKIDVSGITYAAAKLQLALCFHHAVLDVQDDLATSITRLRELTQSGDYAYYVEIAHFMAGLPLPEHTARARWTDGERQTRERWRNLVRRVATALARLVRRCNVQHPGSAWGRRDPRLALSDADNSARGRGFGSLSGTGASPAATRGAQGERGRLWTVQRGTRSAGQRYVL